MRFETEFNYLYKEVLHRHSQFVHVIWGGCVANIYEFSHVGTQVFILMHEVKILELDLDKLLNTHNWRLVTNCHYKHGFVRNEPAEEKFKYDYIRNA